jgi:UDPglucose 6-dehydrogenase
MNITVIGTGYVGLVTGTCLSETGNMVTCIDIDAEKVRMLQTGNVTIYEPGLEEIFTRNVKEGRLQFTTDLAEGVSGSHIVFLALPTPPGEDGSADLSYVYGVASQLGAHLKGYTVVIDKSTVPVGTAEQVAKNLSASGAAEYDVVSNPEFLREGFAVHDFMNPDRIVVGTESERALEVLRQLYAPFIQQGAPLITMDIRSAELTKYATNAFLVTKISFMNEIANVCEKVGANVDAVRLGMGTDERIGSRFLNAGLGYGGSCFPKDVMALAKTAADNDYDFKILQAVTEINRLQKQRYIEKVMRHFGGDVKGKKFAHWGLSFKPDTDDVRQAPALEIIAALTNAGAVIVAYDPEGMENARRALGEVAGLQYAESQYKALQGADALLITTEWEQFRSPDFSKMRSLLKEPVIFDGRNMYDLQMMRNEGFRYESIGRKTIEI